MCYQYIAVSTTTQFRTRCCFLPLIILWLCVESSVNHGWNCGCKYLEGVVCYEDTWYVIELKWVWLKYVCYGRNWVEKCDWGSGYTDTFTWKVESSMGIDLNYTSRKTDELSQYLAQFVFKNANVPEHNSLLASYH